MKKNKTISEQIANRCIHFTGLMEKECKVGIKYDSVKVPNVRPYKFPCLKDSDFSGGSCNEAHFPTLEEAEKQAKEVIEEGEQTVKAYSAIKEAIKETGSTNGTIQCPACNGKLNYNAASSNGHIWAKCKCGFGWME